MSYLSKSSQVGMIKRGSQELLLKFRQFDFTFHTCFLLKHSLMTSYC